MTTFSLLVKPSGADCNLHCTYCFYRPREQGCPQELPSRMTSEILERIVASYLATDQPTYAFGWQGGEPTLMGLDFFRTVTRLQSDHGQRGSIIVTNGGYTYFFQATVWP